MEEHQVLSDFLKEWRHDMEWGWLKELRLGPFLQVEWAGPRKPFLQAWPWQAIEALLKAAQEVLHEALKRRPGAIARGFIAGTVADAILEASGVEVTLEGIRPLREGLLAPGAFYGDLYAARMGDLPALQRLAEKRFPRGAVFHPDRWRLLEPAFADRRGDGSFQQAWLDLAVPALALAVEEVPGDVRLGEVYQWLRGHVRKEIERDLLDGRTLDRRGEVLLPDTPEAEALEREVQAEAEALMFLLVELTAGLSVRELAILLAQHGDDPALAERYGTTPEAIRKERQRIREKLRENFA